MKFKIWNKKTKKMVGPFSMTDIKAYDGEEKTIWFDDGNEEVTIGNDLGYGQSKNHTKEIQEDLLFVPCSGMKDNNGNDLYEYDMVEFMQDIFGADIERGMVTLQDGVYGVLEVENNHKFHALKDLYSVEFKRNLN